MKDLNEAQRRYLRRIAEQMRGGYTGRIEMDMKNGGIGDYREIRSLKPVDLEGGDIDELLRAS